MTTREYMANRLREYRQACHLSVKEVGESIGKSDKTVSAWEVGRGQPDADMLVRLCKLYGVRISDFYTDDAQGIAEDESALLDSFRRLSDNDRSVALRVVEALAQSRDQRV